jgi:hypothetical protein
LRGSNISDREAGSQEQGDAHGKSPECVAEKGSSSFLKKRTKRLLLQRLLPQPTDKSLLVLFFRKELLPALYFPAGPKRLRRDNVTVPV